MSTSSLRSCRVCGERPQRMPLSQVKVDDPEAEERLRRKVLGLEDKSKHIAVPEQVPPARSGVLVKRGDRFLRGWTERYIVLRHGELAYYENTLTDEAARRAAQPRGVLQLHEEVASTPPVMGYESPLRPVVDICKGVSRTIICRGGSC
ncbi:hypothetical protein T484DRAFT_1778508 [Baffinella frigidus]|nr:hypothetical protein T484DRAFT_1778508 [Cryptophyta sp. CCMP2293]